MPSEDDRDAGDDERGLGERPGMNQSPLGPSFRDGPRRSPASTGSLLLGAVPAAIIALVVLYLQVR